MDQDSPIAAVSAVFEAINAQNCAQALAAVARDFHLVDESLGQSWYGREGWEQWLDTWSACLPSQIHRLQGLGAQGDMVVATRHCEGTLVAPLATPKGLLAPRGQWLQLRFAELFVVRDGAIAQMRSYWDMTMLDTQASRAWA
jgi:ketosteroid isomerase-like protein